MNRKRVLLLCIFFLCLSRGFAETKNPFLYDLHFTKIVGTNNETMICFHGLGGDWSISQAVKKFVPDTVVGFNFPDYGLIFMNYDAEKTTFGTVKEILPALYVLKRCIIDEKHTDVNLYGFSAGGGAIINCLSLLNTSFYDSYLLSVGITPEDKERILEVLQKGWILLDAPLKSVAEIVDFRGPFKDLLIVGKRYRDNNMEPIHALANLEGLGLRVLVYFQHPDDILSNRDDALFIERLKKYNEKGTTQVVIGKEGSHLFPHPLLWKVFSDGREKLEKLQKEKVDSEINLFERS